MDADEKFPCGRCDNYLMKKRRLLEQLEPSFGGGIEPVVTAIMEDAESSLADTMVPLKPPRFQSDDQMVAADEFTKSRERGIEAYIKKEPVYEHLGGSSYRCKAK